MSGDVKAHTCELYGGALVVTCDLADEDAQTFRKNTLIWFIRSGRLNNINIIQLCVSLMNHALLYNDRPINQFVNQILLGVT